MPTWPIGVETVSIPFGKGIVSTGEMTAATLDVEVLFTGTQSAVWDGDGTPLYDFSVKSNANEGQVGSVTIPVVDQAGWLDDDQRAYTMWGYKLTETPRYGSMQGTPRTKYLQPLSGQGEIDFDRIPNGRIGLPVSAPVVPVTSVNGQTGAVTVEGMTEEQNAELTAATEALEGRLSEDELKQQIVGESGALIAAAVEPKLDKAEALSKYSRVAAPLPGSIITDNTYATATHTPAQTTAKTARWDHLVAVDAADIRFVYGNWYTHGTTFIDTDNANPITIRASVEIGGVIYRLTFGGKIETVIDPGGMVVTDPLPLEVAAGTKIYSRTYVSGTTYFGNHVSFFGQNQGGWALGDLTAPGAAAIADAAGYTYTPFAILGTPSAGKSVQQIIAAGDSIASGQGDASGFAGWTGSGTGGFITRALHGLVGFINTAVPGDNCANYVANAGHFRRARFIGAATHAICEYGRNDLNLVPLATVQANLILAWKLFARRGVPVFQTTITPQTSSTDGFTTQAGQVADNAGGTEVNRVTLNNWLRAGAPISSTTGQAVAVGTANAIVAGSPTHPLSVYSAASPVIEVADLAESSRNSGKWKTPNARAFEDGTIATGALSVLTSPTAAFTAADVGRTVCVVGAGAAGGKHISKIGVFTNATTVTLSTVAITPVAGAAVTLANVYAADGLHPTDQGAVALAPSIVVSNFD
jgi:lysophospholipase L1-like esterase